ncbi:hypothetical protein [Riemerella columbina]|uniref:hypothetical protein n=1 Tax=Riemerella columbina TaxID=103810 RepID=UPI00266EFBDE|nr:hypothetical protein [Riemerella columbina]WKS95803.1 hypothetical protein NYR17_03420 [Riemerella columbina]
MNARLSLLFLCIIGLLSAQHYKNDRQTKNFKDKVKTVTTTTSTIGKNGKITKKNTSQETFSLNGDIETLKLDGKTYHYKYQYNEKGQKYAAALLDEGENNPNNVSTFIYDDSSNRIIEYLDIKRWFININTFDEHGTLTATTLYNIPENKEITTLMHYNAHGDIERISVEQTSTNIDTKHQSIQQTTAPVQHYTFKYTNYDAHGNWTECITYLDNKKVETIQRQMTYDED